MAEISFFMEYRSDINGRWQASTLGVMHFSHLQTMASFHKMNNRSIYYKQKNLQTCAKFQDPHYPPHSVFEIMNIWSLMSLETAYGIIQPMFPLRFLLSVFYLYFISTNSPQSLLDKTDLRFFRHRQEQCWTNKQRLNILVTLLQAFYIIYF